MHSQDLIASNFCTISLITVIYVVEEKDFKLASKPYISFKCYKSEILKLFLLATPTIVYKNFATLKTTFNTL